MGRRHFKRSGQINHQLQKRRDQARPRARISWTAYGTEARACVAQALSDYRRSPHRPSFSPIVMLGDPWWLTSSGVDMSMLVLSDDARDQFEELEADLATLSINANNARNSGIRVLRLAWLIGKDPSTFRSLGVSLQALGFTVFKGSGLSPLDVRATIVGLVSIMWFPGPICIDFMDLLTVLSRRTGMRGIVLRSSVDQVERTIREHIASAELLSVQGIFAMIHADGSLTMEDLEAVQEGIVRALEPLSDYDTKCAVQLRRTGDRLLAGDRARVWLMLCCR